MPFDPSRHYETKNFPACARRPPVCREVPLRIAGYATRAEASVLDLMSLLGPNAPVVHGMISLRTFAGRALTLDPRAQRLIVENAAAPPRP